MYKLMKFDDIKVSEAFKQSSPSKKKINECLALYEKYYLQDRPIVIDEQNYLIDGYVFYIVAKMKGLDEVIVTRSSSKVNIRWVTANPEMYVFAYHPNSIDKNILVWRLPEELYGEDILPGDSVIVQTKWGKRRTVVVKIEQLNVRPYKGRIRDVVRRFENEID